MADWFIATEGVKVVKDSASLWPQIITAVSSAGSALGRVALTHHFTRKRDEDAAMRKRNEERLFITTELVFCWSAMLQPGQHSYGYLSGLCTKRKQYHHLIFQTQPVTG